MGNELSLLPLGSGVVFAGEGDDEFYFAEGALELLGDFEGGAALIEEVDDLAAME